MPRKILWMFLLNVLLFCLPGILFAAEKPTLEQIVAANANNLNLVKTYDVESTTRVDDTSDFERRHIQGNGEKKRRRIYRNHEIAFDTFEEGNRAYCCESRVGNVYRFQVLERDVPPTTPTFCEICEIPTLEDILRHAFKDDEYGCPRLDRLFKARKATVEESSVDSHGHTLWRINVQDAPDSTETESKSGVNFRDINLYVNADHAFAVQKITCTMCLMQEMERPRNDKREGGRETIKSRYKTVAEIDDFQEVAGGCHVPKGRIVVRHEPLTEVDKNEPRLGDQTITLNHILINEKIADDAFDFRLEPGSVVEMIHVRSAKHDPERSVLSSEVVIWGENNQPERQATWAEVRALPGQEWDAGELLQNILSGEAMHDAGAMVADTLQQVLIR